VTALAPPAAAQVTKPATSSGGRSGSVTWMALPALVVFIGFGLVPLFGVLFLSFTSWDGIGAIHSAGIQNWKTVLSDPGTLHALWVTFLITALSWAFQTPISLLIGTFLAGRQRYRGFLAVLFFLPLLLSSAALAITYKALLDPNFGLGTGLGVSFLTQDWLGRGPLAVGVLVFVVSWQFIPFHSLLYQAGVRQIPASLYEAAQIDGAGPVREFLSITLPSLRNEIGVCVTVTVIAALSAFDIVFISTRGGPGEATMVPGLKIYQLAFFNREVGLASALAVVLMILVLLCILPIQWLTRRGSDS
jgi:raffinose/stachyose/melibiose transport system permease protein